MMQEKKPDQAGADKASVKQDEASHERKPGELSIEELAKVSGGRVKFSGALNPIFTNQTGFAGPLNSTFQKG